MRVSTTLLAAVAASAAVILLSACSSAPEASTSGLLPIGASGSRVQPAPYRGKDSAILRKLYVTDNVNNDVALFKYGTWTSLGTITSGIAHPYGDWVDKNGNLYVVNRPTSGGDITEYDATGSLIFTYSAGMHDPVSVTTDKVGNVYEADQTGMVAEYAQKSNMAAATCSLQSGYEALGVAVNGRGRVFVTFDSTASTGTGGIIVYPQGLAGRPYACANATLPVKIVHPIGIAFDKQGNLVACDANPYAPAVDVIAPPFSSVTRTLGSGWVIPFFASIDRAGTQAYVTDPGAADVQVLTYPSGTNVATLGSADGLSLPVSTVDSKNYVP